jgi:hypothetical protein
VNGYSILTSSIPTIHNPRYCSTKPPRSVSQSRLLDPPQPNPKRAPISRRRSCPARRRASRVWPCSAAAARPRHQNRTAATEGGASRRPPHAAPGRADQLAGRRCVCVPHRRQYLCCWRPLRSGALLPLPAVSSDELDRNKPHMVSHLPARLLPPLDVAINCRKLPTHLLLIATIRYSHLPIVDSST